MIDAEFRSEERFSRLALAYETQEEKSSVSDCLERITKEHSVSPETYTTKVSNGKEVLIIEFHDDNAREAGDIFEEIIKSLGVKTCN